MWVFQQLAIVTSRVMDRTCLSMRSIQTPQRLHAAKEAQPQQRLVVRLPFLNDARRDKAVLVNFSISVLEYARKKNANLVQGNIGYFFNATCISKRIIDVLHRLGVSISY